MVPTASQLGRGPNQGIFARVPPVHGGKGIPVETHSYQTSPGCSDQQDRYKQSTGYVHAIGPACQEEIDDGEDQQGAETMTTRRIMEKGTNGLLGSFVP